MGRARVPSSAYRGCFGGKAVSESKEERLKAAIAERDEANRVWVRAARAWDEANREWIKTDRKVRRIEAEP